MCMPTRGASALYVCLHAERMPYMYALCVSLHVYDKQVELRLICKPYVYAYTWSQRLVCMPACGANALYVCLMRKPTCV